MEISRCEYTLNASPLAQDRGRGAPRAFGSRFRALGGRGEAPDP